MFKLRSSQCNLHSDHMNCIRINNKRFDFADKEWKKIADSLLLSLRWGQKSSIGETKVQGLQ
jgi:hypothetical protein